MYTDEWRHLNGVWLHYQDWQDWQDWPDQQDRPDCREPASQAGPGRLADVESRPETLLLLHGLTQQSHVFDAFAAQLARRHRVVALDFRGRGESHWAPGTYTVPHYAQDVLALLDTLSVETVHVLGTSLGGLVGLHLAAVAPERLRSLVLNDIGCEIDPRGAARIQAYAAAVPDSFPDLGRAAAWALEQYPWLGRMAPDAVADAVRWAVRRGPDGRWRLKFDPAIGRAPRPTPEAVRAASQAWWAALESLRCPVLLLRGADSDIVSAATAVEMAARQPRLVRADVPDVGHAPTLAEPAAVAALRAFYGAGARVPEPDGGSPPRLP
jgi:pimeloyl-ACP methyl ester carboxylesterase